ncbi:MAG TPA: hypothetical protein VME69_09205 [Methylocella sp.]|nr:hypothetical protein [Methylocella sp.]
MLDLVDWRPSIWHVTLQTGQSSRSYRQDIADAAIHALRPLLRADGEYPIPSVADRRLWVTRTGRLLLATVLAETSICTMAVADRSVGAQKLWHMIHKGVETATDPESPPRAPWCAARIEPGFSSHLDDREWLADFQRCLAWTWIESLPGRRLLSRR